MANVYLYGMLLFQEAVGWDVLSMWRQMGFAAKAVVVILFLMSAWSIGVMIDRYLAFTAARKQSRTFAPLVAGALREGKVDEAVRVAERHKKSHLAKVVTAGLQEYQAHQASAELSGEASSTPSRASPSSRPPGSPQSLAEFPRRWLPRPWACSWPSRPFGHTTISPTRWSRMTSRWTIPLPS